MNSEYQDILIESLCETIKSERSMCEVLRAENKSLDFDNKNLVDSNQILESEVKKLQKRVDDLWAELDDSRGRDYPPTLDCDESGMYVG